MGVESGLPGHPRGWVLSGALLVPGLQGVEEVGGWQEQAWSQGHGGEQAGPLERTGPEGRQGEEDREARLWGGLEGETFSREQGPPPRTLPPHYLLCPLSACSREASPRIAAISGAALLLNGRLSCIPPAEQCLSESDNFL